MSVLSIIQENDQEEICSFCEVNILGCKKSTLTFLCEGRWCEEASEMFYEDFPERAEKLPEWINTFSKEVIEAEKKLERRFAAFESEVNFAFAAMNFCHKINMINIKIEGFKNENKQKLS